MDFAFPVNPLRIMEGVERSSLNPITDGITQTGEFSENILSTGEIVAGVLIPEPSAVILGTIGLTERLLRRWRKTPESPLLRRVFFEKGWRRLQYQHAPRPSPFIAHEIPATH
jgi:hypothetical protein